MGDEGGITEDLTVEQGAFFPISTDTHQQNSGPVCGVARVQRPDREQMQMRIVDLDGLIPADHGARAIWEYVDRLPLTEVYAKILAVEGHAGRTPVDPKIHLALWLYATVEGVGSSRALAELCEAHQAYQWICGGVRVNYHGLSDFRTAHVELLDGLLTESVATLTSTGLVELNRVAQDGMRVRASAGASSFRRERSLQECLEEAEEQVRRLREELGEDPGASRRRSEAARERAAAERKARVEEALRQLPEVQAKKKSEEKGEARVSTTDPDARVMKMGDGGFRPAYNVEFATDTQSQVIVGVDVTSAGSDQGQMAPMVEQIEARHGCVPAEVLVDGGFTKKEDIDAVTAKGCTVYAPVPQPRKKDRDAHVPLADDSEAVAAWRIRMGTAAAKEIYKERASTAECVNALARNRGLRQFLVRGLRKVRAVALWYALAHNVMRILALQGAGAVVT